MKFHYLPVYVFNTSVIIGSKSFSSIIYRNLTGVLSPTASFNSGNVELDSSVMTVKLDQWQENADFTITMTFRNIKESNVVATCSYRNESRNVWTRDGCIRKSYNSSETVCECNHLTYFAILMSQWTEENVDTQSIGIISIARCSIPLLGLVVTMLTHLYCWR